ncbi:SsrA-binding protein [bacterium]|uniref:SsrA-binding protein n=1 Tax=candidate division WOR-3 bacterium TaxID=2052148 RepID=A0A7C0VCW6_UNCW3|nr:MAG: SsrA-binding protein [bacterium]RKZ20701.1 MAG: SsrA-binding protein [bacterium]HDI82598.1 SsrA-binding protein SmpB [candidate division WOR-3 bacterium]
MRVITRNRKAFREYEIIQRMEAGIVLHGNEVKSVRAGKVSIQEAYAGIEDGEVFIYNMTISPYEKESYHTDPTRKRKLLLHKKEIKRLIGKVKERGFTLVPLSVYINDRGYVKIELALAKGKKIYEKREIIKRREMEREMERSK